MRKVYNKIESVSGNVISVRATDVLYEELAEMRKPAVADKSGGPEALH